MRPNGKRLFTFIRMQRRATSNDTRIIGRVDNPFSVLTEAGVLHGVAVVVVDLVAALALVADDALRGAVAAAGLVVAVGRLTVALASWKSDQTE
jgi:hypothetical protein